MVYLKSFTLPDLQQEADSLTPSAYPGGIFPPKKLEEIFFSPITIFYGGNGSGKSTLLNLISEKLNLPRSTPFCPGPYFQSYVNKKCRYTTGTDDEGLSVDIPYGSKIITSEDIFNYIISVRNDNLRINKKKEIEKQNYVFYKDPKNHFTFRSMDDYDELKIKSAVNKKTMASFITDRVGNNIEQFSNGETALSYFDKEFISNRLYLLDEPENSMSPKFQLQLAKLIFDCAHYFDCQFVIATHSPFLLAVDGAVIYDLDTVPTLTRNWYELENVKIYFDFFNQYRDFFKED